MRHIFLPFFYLSLASISVAVNAEIIDHQNVPEGISTYLHDKHPSAEEITIKDKNHFGRQLYEVRFKETKTENDKTYKQDMDELFRTNGDYFTNVYQVEHHGYNVMSDKAKKSLQSHYPDYKILSMRMISNPNGNGEEYEINLMVSGKNLNVTFNNFGDLISESEKQQ